MAVEEPGAAARVGEARGTVVMVEEAAGATEATEERWVVRAAAAAAMAAAAPAVAAVGVEALVAEAWALGLLAVAEMA
jgi:hypothetical protein